MGFSDFMWGVSPVGRITKVVAKKFVDKNHPELNSIQLMMFMGELGYPYPRPSEIKIVEFIEGNPLLFIYYLICVEYKNKLGHVANSTRNFSRYVFKTFDELNINKHIKYVGGPSDQHYEIFYSKCEYILNEYMYR